VAQRGRRWRVRLSEPAEHDYVAILQWTAEQFGRRQASVYRETLIGALIALADDPFAPDSHPREDIQPSLRSLHVARNQRRGRHLILYRLAGQRTIDILRILHDSMDVGRHIPDDPTPSGS
jgi:toxin ParE1/3/4